MVFIFYLEQLDLQSLIFEVSSTSWRAKDEKNRRRNWELRQRKSGPGLLDVKEREGGTKRCAQMAHSRRTNTESAIAKIINGFTPVSSMASHAQYAVRRCKQWQICGNGLRINMATARAHTKDHPLWQREVTCKSTKRKKTKQKKS